MPSFLLGSSKRSTPIGNGARVYLSQVTLCMSPQRILIYLRRLFASSYPSIWGYSASARISAITRIISSYQKLLSRERSIVYSIRPSSRFTLRTTAVCSPDEARNNYRTSVAPVRSGPSRCSGPSGVPLGRVVRSAVGLWRQVLGALLRPGTPPPSPRVS